MKAFIILSCLCLFSPIFSNVGDPLLSLPMNTPSWSPLDSDNLAQNKNVYINNRILANINGSPISVMDVMKKMDMVFYKQYPQYASSPEARFQFYYANWRPFLKEIIHNELIYSDAKEKKLGWEHIVFIASVWTLIEWSRLFIVCGFPFNPLGLSATALVYPTQLAAIGGVFFLTFWVMLTNLTAVKMCLFNHLRDKLFFIVFAVIPFLFGAFYIHIYAPRHMHDKQNVGVFLVQTAISPIEKEGLLGWDKMLHPLEQWEHILHILREPHQGVDKPDIIVLPEYAVPFPAYEPIIKLDSFASLFQDIFDMESSSYYPDLLEPYAWREDNQYYISHAFIAQTLANFFDAELIIGLEDLDIDSSKIFTSAFSFKPQNINTERYDKRVLLPIVEYIPFQWLKPIAKKYGISNWFERGVAPGVFSGNIPLGPSVCIDEVYGRFIRLNRLSGANMFVNVTNDVWFPYSKLPEQHLFLGRLRSVENGVYSLRSCNTGITAVIDPFGRIIASLDQPFRLSEWCRGKVAAKIPFFHIATPYTYFGDGLIIGICVCCIIGGLYRKIYRH